MGFFKDQFFVHWEHVFAVVMQPKKNECEWYEEQGRGRRRGGDLRFVFRDVCGEDDGCKKIGQDN